MGRILIAEDDDAIRTLLGKLLAFDDHEVAAAPDGAAALVQLKKNLPDLLILDVMMPMMDGYAVLREMKSAGILNDVRILLLTAKNSESDWVKGFRLGADAYFPKPFDPEELATAVNEMLATSKDELARARNQELDRSELLSRLESAFD